MIVDKLLNTSSGHIEVGDPTLTGQYLASRLG
jgi:hypothetical protein